MKIIKKDYMEISLDDYIRDLEVFQSQFRNLALKEKIYIHLEDPEIDIFEGAYLFTEGIRLSEYINILKIERENNGDKIIETGYHLYIRKENINANWEKDDTLEISRVALAEF